MRSAVRAAMQLEMDPNAATPQDLGTHKIAMPTTQVQLGLAKPQQCHLREDHESHPHPSWQVALLAKGSLMTASLSLAPPDPRGWARVQHTPSHQTAACCENPNVGTRNLPSQGCRRM